MSGAGGKAGGKAGEVSAATCETHAREVPALVIPLMPPTADERIGYVMRLMADGLWERGETGPQIAAEWGLTDSALRTYAAEASRSLKRLGERDVWVDMIRVRAMQRLDGDDWVQVARLAMDTVGGFTQKHEVAAGKLEPSQLVIDCLAFIEEHPEHHARLLEAAERIRSRLLVSP